MTILSPYALERAVVAVGAHVHRIRIDQEARSYSEAALLSELVACVLGSQVRFEVARAAADRLDQCGALQYDPQRDSAQDVLRKVRAILGSAISDNEGRILARRHRFWRQRAKDVATIVRKVCGGGIFLRELIGAAPSERARRMVLVEHMPGIGPKQASLFLRNVGYAENLAILDVHVLRFMRYIGLLPVPEISVTTLRRYEVAEERLLAYSLGLGWPMATLDEAIWVVMRAAGRLPS